VPPGQLRALEMLRSGEARNGAVRGARDDYSVKAERAFADLAEGVTTKECGEPILAIPGTRRGCR
jgi:hypothetical protein